MGPCALKTAARAFIARKVPQFSPQKVGKITGWPGVPAHWRRGGWRQAMIAAAITPARSAASAPAYRRAGSSTRLLSRGRDPGPERGRHASCSIRDRHRLQVGPGSCQRALPVIIRAQRDDHPRPRHRRRRDLRRSIAPHRRRIPAACRAPRIRESCQRRGSVWQAIILQRGLQKPGPPGYPAVSSGPSAAHPRPSASNSGARCTRAGGVRPRISISTSSPSCTRSAGRKPCATDLPVKWLNSRPRCKSPPPRRPARSAPRPPHRHRSHRR